jgi:Fur family transcriptional regulator, ferric uptake regulator
MNGSTDSMKDGKQITNRVHELDLRNTRLRDNMVTFVKERPGLGYSENEIKQMLESPNDRTTIYRTIKALLKKVFIHKIVCENGVLKYALNDSTDDFSHAHFQCNQCEKVICLKEPLCKIPSCQNPLRRKHAAS